MPAPIRRHLLVLRRLRPAFTLVEAAVSIVIVGVMFVAAVSTVAAAARSRSAQADWRRADGLGRALLAEIVHHPYGSTSGPIAPSIVLGAGVTDRRSFGVIDDYHGLTDSPPRQTDGAALGGFAGWSRAVSVQRVDPAEPLGASTGPNDHGLKRITVAVRSPSGRTFEYVALRSRWSVSDLDPSAAAGRAGAAVVRLRLVGGGEIVAGAWLPNRPLLPDNALVPDVAGGAGDNSLLGDLLGALGGGGKP